MPAQLAQTLQPKPRISNVRTAKQATQRRVRRKALARYSALRSFCAMLFAGLACAMLYVMLTAHLTSLNYAMARAERQRADLQAEAARLDDRLAQLESDDRLARLASSLHMSDPQQFAVVTLPARVKREDGSHLAFLSSLTSLLRAK